jgi:hypothetical protein
MWNSSVNKWKLYKTSLSGTGLLHTVILSRPERVAFLFCIHISLGTVFEGKIFKTKESKTSGLNESIDLKISNTLHTTLQAI